MSVKDATDTEIVTDSSAEDGELTAEELAEFDGDWGDGEVVAEEDDAKGDDEQASDSKPKPKSTDKADEESEDDSTEEDEETETADKAADDDSEEEVADDSKDDKSEEAKSTLTPEEQKRHNDEMAKARIAEKNARDAAAKATKQAQEATIERYLREAGDDELELERRQLNVEQFRLQEEKIEVNQEKLSAGIDRAVATIPLFKTGSPAVKEELAKSLDDFERMYVKKNDKGQPIEVLGNVVEFLQAKADSIMRLTGDGATQQDKSKKKQQSRTITPPVKAPKKAKADEMSDGFDEEAKRY